MIRLFNSLTQQKEPFEPRDPGKAGVYCCGPTVYNLVHIGNARPYVTFAVLRSWLAYRGLDVKLVTNITDVDDKIIKKANDEGRDSAAVAEEYTAAYVEDTDRLGIPRPDVEPKATETIAEIVDLVCQLISGGHAYEADGSVYFKVRSFDGYGKLSGQRIDELEEGVRVDAEPGKADPLDFAVWKAAKPGEPAWDSPWGLGRPGWHIECSAMGLRYLGAGFDVHGGGRDLIFPHHENEIAQSEAAGLPFARVWMHNGMIRSEGEKMAKSVGNIFLLREVLDRYDPAVVLTYFLTTHYRSPLEFSTDKLDEAKAAYGRFASALADIDFRVANAGKAAARGECPDLTLRAEAARVAFAERMDDDLNTAGAIGELFGLVGEMYRYLTQVDRGEMPLDTLALTAVGDALRESLGGAAHPGAGRRRRPHRRRQRRRRRRGRLRHRRRGAAAGRPARRGGPLGRRRAGVRGQARLRRRLLRLRAARPLPGREAVGGRRPAARRDPGGRLRAPRHAAGHPGREEVGAGSRETTTVSGERPDERPAAGQPNSSAPTSAAEPTMPPATPVRNAAVAYCSARSGALRRRTRLATASTMAAARTRTAAAAAAASRPPCMTATGRSVTTGRTSAAIVSAARSPGLRPQRAAIASRATGDSTVHQNSTLIVTAANEPGEMSMGMTPVYRRPG